jgi:hypothetical protein
MTGTTINRQFFRHNMKKVSSHPPSPGMAMMSWDAFRMSQLYQKGVSQCLMSNFDGWMNNAGCSAEPIQSLNEGIHLEQKRTNPDKKSRTIVRSCRLSGIHMWLDRISV